MDSEEKRKGDRIRGARYRAKNKEKIALRRKEAYQDDIDHRRKLGREAAERHKENSPKKLLAATARYRDKNRDKINEKQRAWRKENPDGTLERTRKVRRDHPEKYSAQTQANNAVQRGGLKSPETCEICDKKLKLEKHHKNYSKPLEVVWCCRSCHGKLDRIRREAETN